MIPRYPNMAVARPHDAMLHDGPGWSNPYYYLFCTGRPDSEGDAKHSVHE
jgi:hypothetical protein